MKDSTQESIGRFKTAMERIRSGESDSEEVDLPSGRVRLAPDPEAPNGVKIEVLDRAGEDAAPAQRNPEAIEAAKRAAAIIQRFRAGELDTAEIPLPTGGTMKLVRDGHAPGAFTIQPPEGGPRVLSVLFEAADARPDGYPDELPFLAGLSSALSSMEGQPFRTLSWGLSEDPGESLENLRLQLTEAGWREEGESSVSAPSGTTKAIEFSKGDTTRSLMVSRVGERSMIRLVEHRGKDGEPEAGGTPDPDAS